MDRIRWTKTIVLDEFQKIKNRLSDIVRIRRLVRTCRPAMSMRDSNCGVTSSSSYRKMLSHNTAKHKTVCASFAYFVEFVGDDDDERIVPHGT